MATPVTTLRIDADLKARLNSLCELDNTNQSDIMRLALVKYLDEKEYEHSLRQASIKAYRDYQETGLHLTSDEFFGWVSTWGTDNEKDAPECHR